MEVDFETMSLHEMVQLQSDLLAAMTRRFQRKLALVFTDVVGSTPYFAKYGDVAGRALQQRHLEAVRQAIAPHGGRIVDTAGDGAFLCFPDADEAAAALIELQQIIEAGNADHPPQHHLVVRVGLHFGPVLTDGGPVSGDAVNLCARVASSAEAGQIRATEEAFHAFSSALRVRCRPLPPASLKGIEHPVRLLELPWKERRAIPTRLQLVPTGEVFALPDKDVIRIGRLDEAPAGGGAANDVVLGMSPRVSRWHCELHRRGDAMYLRSVTDAATRVGDRDLLRNEEAPVAVGTIVRLGDAVTFQLAAEATRAGAEATAYVSDPSARRA